MWFYLKHNLCEPKQPIGKDPVLQGAIEKNLAFFSTSYWENDLALENQFDAMSLALHGENVDRVFWSIGRGGVGQSLLTAHIHELFKGISAFLDVNIYYTDDEMRKQADLLFGKVVVTGQEAVEG